MPDELKTSYRVVAGGFLVLVLAMGIGRFAYTPLLPPMMTEYRFGTEEAGLLASLNYAGYLAGAFLAGALCRAGGEGRVLTAGLALSVATTAGTGLTLLFPLLSVIRFLSGVASAFCFVAASGAVLGILARQRREGLAGLLYGGVGSGIVISGVLAVPLASRYGASGAWMLLGLLAAVLAVAARCLMQGILQNRGPAGAGGAAPPLPRDRRFLRLVAAYGLEGFGYIITGTFLVAAARTTFGPAGAATAWMVAGCAAIPSAFLWSLAGRRSGALLPLVGAHVLQAFGIALPVLYPSPAGILVGAFLFGGTFMGIVTLAFSSGGAFLPAARGRIIALMTVVYSTGQIIGPALAGYLAAQTGSFNAALFLAAGAVLSGGLLLLPDALNEQRRAGGK